MADAKLLRPEMTVKIKNFVEAGGKAMLMAAQ